MATTVALMGLLHINFRQNKDERMLGNKKSSNECYKN